MAGYGSSTALTTSMAAPPLKNEDDYADTMLSIDYNVGKTDADEVAEGYVPEGFETVEEYLKCVREEYDADAAYDRANREAALDDLKFVAGEQWDPLVQASRLAQGRPCLTTNVLTQFIGQVVGDRRINSTSIKVKPKKDATVEVAEVRSGLIKSIEEYSRADRVYDAACEDQVTCGIGNFRIDMDWADNDVFEQDIFIRQIPNPLAVVWDYMSTDITGRDASRCFVQDTMPRKVYEKKWGKENPCPGEFGDSLTSTMVATGWFDKDIVKVMEHWRMIERVREFALMQDGDVKDVTDLDPASYEQQLYVDPNTGKPRMRRGIRTYAQMHLVTAFAILEGPYELPLTRLPIIKVSGREVRVGDDRIRFGITRFAKDPQRLMNYSDSVAAETMALAPKAQWIAPDDAVEGREEDFRNAHRDGDPLLIYNKKAGTPPMRVDPPPFPAAWAELSQQHFQKIKDVTGLQNASLGMRSNEISGRAIQARQREGDVATVIYHDNVNASILEGGDVVNQLIPIAYDTVRQLRVIGDDDKHKVMTVNDPNDAESPDITSGKYEVSLETGPSYTTQRQEAADAMMQAIQVAPQLMSIAGDLIVKAQDWPGAVEIAERLHKTIPPQLLSDDDPLKQAASDPNSPEAQQMAQQQQAQAAQMAQLGEEFQHASDMRKLEIQEKMAGIVKAEAEAHTAQAKVSVAEADARAAHANARAAHANATKAEAEAIHAPVRHTQELNHAERAALAKEEAAKAAARSRSAGPQPGAGRGKPAAPQKNGNKK